MGDEMASGMAGGVTGGVEMGMGIMQKIQAGKLKKDANSAAPPPIDPTQASFLSELNQKRASLDSGSAYAAGLNNIRASQAGTNTGLVQAGGGNVGGTIQSLLQSQQTSNDSVNSLNAQGEQEQNFNNSMYGDLLNKIAARKMQLQMQKSQQLRAEWAAKDQSANQNLMAGTATFLSTMNSSGSGKSTPSTDTANPSAGESDAPEESAPAESAPAESAPASSATTPVGANDGDEASGAEAGEGAGVQAGGAAGGASEAGGAAAAGAGGASEAGGAAAAGAGGASEAGGVLTLLA